MADPNDYLPSAPFRFLARVLREFAERVDRREIIVLEVGNVQEATHIFQMDPSGKFVVGLPDNSTTLTIRFRERAPSEPWKLSI